MSIPTVSWSLVVANGASDIARSAWSELVANYRSAIHAYFRSRFGASTADDLTQAFIDASIAGDWWARAEIDRGTFRVCLRTLLRQYGAHHAEDPAHARTFSDDVDRLVDPGADPEVAYEREFARAVVSRALARMRAQAPDLREHDVMLPSLLHRGDHADLKRLSVELSLTPNALLLRLRKMRVALREVLRAELTRLAAGPSELHVEMLRLQRNLKHRKL